MKIPSLASWTSIWIDRGFHCREFVIVMTEPSQDNVNTGTQNAMDLKIFAMPFFVYYLSVRFPCPFFVLPIIVSGLNLHPLETMRMFMRPSESFPDGLTGRAYVALKSLKRPCWRARSEAAPSSTPTRPVVPVSNSSALFYLFYLCYLLYLLYLFGLFWATVSVNVFHPPLCYCHSMDERVG